MRHANPTFSFSPVERAEIAQAWIMTSLAFAIFFIRTDWFPVERVSFAGFAMIFAIAAVTAGLGFVVHELCHKYVAHRYRVHGEFRAHKGMLFFSVLLAFLGFLFAAPGAVVLSGITSRREAGHIAAAGPVSNMVLALLFLPLASFADGLLAVVGAIGLVVNALLGAFNLIPFLGLDGEQVLAWNKLAYAVLVVLAAAIAVLAFA